MSIVTKKEHGEAGERLDPGIVDPVEARRRGWGDTVTYKGDDFDRLENILPTLNVADGWSVRTNGYAESYGPGEHLLARPVWRQNPDEPFEAGVEVAVGPADESGETYRGRVGMSWLVFEENGREHTLTGLDIKVDEEGTLYALGRYASLSAQSKCVGCDRVIVCGMNPNCW